MRKPSILFWDLETSPIVTTTWGLGQTYLTINNLLEDWYILCACWKYAGSDKVHSAKMTKPGDDYALVKQVRDVLADADLVVHHYGDAFDLKKFNARLIIHGLPPLPNITTVDTKKAVSKIAAMTSNKLEYLAKKVTGEGKIKTDYDLWLKCRLGDKKALKEMITYNKQDVVKLEEWYNYLLPYIKNHPHIWAKYQDRFSSCNNCGSQDLKRNGIRVTAAGVKKQEVQCKKCGHYHRIPVTKV